MELSSSNVKKFLIIFQKKTFLIFQEMELFYILGNEYPEKLPYISGNRTSLYFRRNFQSPKSQNFLDFSKKKL